MTTRSRVATVFSASALCLSLVAAPAAFAAHTSPSTGKSTSASHKHSSKSTKSSTRTATPVEQKAPQPVEK
jgi:hypothetical protein